MSDEKKPTEESLQLAAQCWCDERNRKTEMDVNLAISFAERYDKLKAKLAVAREAFLRLQVRLVENKEPNDIDIAASRAIINGSLDDIDKGDGNEL